MNGVEQLGCNSDLSIHFFSKCLVLANWIRLKTERFVWSQYSYTFVTLPRFGRFHWASQTSTKRWSNVVVEVQGFTTWEERCPKIPFGEPFCCHKRPSAIDLQKRSKGQTVTKHRHVSRPRNVVNSNPLGCQTGSEELRLPNFGPQEVAKEDSDFVDDWKTRSLKFWEMIWTLPGVIFGICKFHIF